MERVFRHPWVIVGVIGVITLFFGLQIPRAQLDNNNFRFVPKDDKARRISKYIDDTFGSSNFILVGLERKYGTVFDGVFLNRIREYVDWVEEIDVAGTVNSMVTSDYITSRDDAIVVEKLMPDDFTGTPEEIAELKQRLLSWDMYRRSLISDDFTATQILVPMDIDPEEAGNPEVIAGFVQIRDKAREMFADQAEVYVTGLPVISAAINESVHADLILLVPLVIVVVLVIVFLPLRRISFVCLSILGVLVAVIWSIGAMPLFGIKLSVISTILPVVLIAVGNSYGLHVIIHYIEGAGKNFNRMNREDHFCFIMDMIRAIATPVTLAMVTTLVSFLSFCFTRVLPIREFGYFSAFGVFASFVTALTLIPALLLIRGPKPLRTLRIKPKTSQRAQSHHYIMDFFMALALKPYPVLILSAVLVVISLYGGSKLIIDNVFVEYFKPNTDIVKAEHFIREKFGGSKVISIVVEADSPEILLHPDTLSAMDNLTTYLTQKVQETGKVMGFTDLIKRINQVFNADESPNGIVRSEELGKDDWGGGLSDFGFDDAGADAAFGFNDPGTEASALNDAASTPFSSFLTPNSPLLPLLDRAVSSGSNRSMSADELVWELRQLTNYEGAAYYEIPADPARYGKDDPQELQRLVSNYLVLLSGNIDSYANDPLEPTAIRSLVQLRAFGQDDTDRAVGAIHRYVAANFPDTLRVSVGGTALVEKSTNDLVVQSVWISMIIALVSLFLIVTLVNRSPVAGLIGVLPLCMLILVNFAVMGFRGIKLNIGTSMISSLIMGIGIDYTIHFLEAYKREYQNRGKDRKNGFLRQVYLTSGTAILVDAVSTGLGFAVLLLSQFTMLEEFGLLIALALLMSALVGLVLIPALLILLKPKFIGGAQ
ncbi:MAG: MMPL family transporter [Treponema sp.]|jgi:predicted RND superfamily exporter protein|nr:MMPL family transporter [Treponema sp.]